VRFFFNKKTFNFNINFIGSFVISDKFELFVFSVYLDDIMGQFFSLFVLTVAAAESAID
jgi:NADH-quinone oxidoreductase subunit K